jgi:uncharacterized protein with GYD domain
MSKYLLEGSYTREGIAALRKSGGTARAQQVKSFVEGAGGKLDAIYWAFGGDDVMAICDFPDNATAAGAATAIAEGGQVQLHTTVLLTAAEVDKAVKAKTGPVPGKAARRPTAASTLAARARKRAT